ncbi:DUF2771 family protein [Kutzneria chonburiensis]|uniref:DUF2771 family protein n=1 Tax=Kutzneria chonburiensis TaxID=1483604 RepID=A0ABV6N322_9PSEU|nr:DUF2771 family protein [Kutzneria chonburiensis]
MSVKRLVPLVLAGAGVLASACSAPPLPQVTFFSVNQTAVTGPTKYCDLKVTKCASDPAAAATLAVPPNKPLQISVPTEVGDAAWQVEFTYTLNGQKEQGRTSVFGRGERLAYTLQLPAGAQLETAAVQRYAGVLTLNPDTGEPEFVIGANWVLTVPGQG